MQCLSFSLLVYNDQIRSSRLRGLNHKLSGVERAKLQTPKKKRNGLTCPDTSLSAICPDPGFCQLSSVNKSDAKTSSQHLAILRVLWSRCLGRFVPKFACHLPCFLERCSFCILSSLSLLCLLAHNSWEISTNSCRILQSYFDTQDWRQIQLESNPSIWRFKRSSLYRWMVRKVRNGLRSV